MSKIVIVAIVVLSIVPIVYFAFTYEAPQAPVVAPQEEVLNTPITIPVPDPENPKAAQCALCAQISDAASQEQCLLDFQCS